MILRKVLGAAALAGVMTLLATLPALAEGCRLPPPPSKVPNGAMATARQMITAMNTLKEYNSDVNVYLECLAFEARENRMAQDVSDMKHNAAVEQLQTIASEFNKQVLIFKSKHG